MWSCKTCAWRSSPHSHTQNKIHQNRPKSNQKIRHWQCQHGTKPGNSSSLVRHTFASQLSPELVLGFQFHSIFNDFSSSFLMPEPSSIWWISAFWHTHIHQYIYQINNWGCNIIQMIICFLLSLFSMQPSPITFLEVSFLCCSVRSHEMIGRGLLIIILYHEVHIKETMTGVQCAFCGWFSQIMCTAKNARKIPKIKT